MVAQMESFWTNDHSRFVYRCKSGSRRSYIGGCNAYFSFSNRFFFFERLPAILFATLPLGILYSIIGFHLAHWLDCSIAAAMVVAATLLFILSIIIGKNNGMIVRRLKT